MCLLPCSVLILGAPCCRKWTASRCSLPQHRSDFPTVSQVLPIEIRNKIRFGCVFKALIILVWNRNCLSVMKGNGERCKMKSTEETSLMKLTFTVCFGIRCKAEIFISGLFCLYRCIQQSLYVFPIAPTSCSLKSLAVTL